MRDEESGAFTALPGELFVLMRHSSAQPVSAGTMPSLGLERSPEITIMNIVRCLALSLVFGSAAGAAQAQLADKKVLTLEGARQIAAAAASEAKRLGAPGGAIAIVDDGGYVLYLERLDNTFPAAANIAIAKARTAALFRRPSKGLEDAIVSGRTSLLAVADAPLQGGEPVVIGGVVLGAIGVSGAASAQQDQEIAKAAADAFAMRLGALPTSR